MKTSLFSMTACSIKNSLTGLADIIFPPRCKICGVLLTDTATSAFCSECVERIPVIRSPLCSRCGMPFPDPDGEDHLCGDCISGHRYFSVARAFGRYEDRLMEGIHLFKYQGKIATGRALGALMADSLYNAVSAEQFSLIIPIPLHPKRLKERGFNQSLILAREVAGKFSIPVDFSVLKRTVFTRPQTTLTRKERMANVKGVFAVDNPERIRENKILLVDDVYTTGSTARECSRVLLENKAATVGVLTLARAVPCGDHAGTAVQTNGTGDSEYA